VTKGRGYEQMPQQNPDRCGTRKMKYLTVFGTAICVSQQARDDVGTEGRGEGFGAPE
jgi:hypothetical protein